LETGSNLKNNFHLAGIVPVANSNVDYGLPWDSSLQMIGESYLAVERSVVECAYAGCETIWLVCNDDVQPLIKKRLGDYIEDPLKLNKHFYVKYPSEHRRQIPIFYTPIHPKDRERRDSYGFSVLHGALTAFIVSDKISKWLTPSRYFVSFPYGVHDPSVVAKYRREISSTKPFFLSYQNKTVREGMQLPFTMNAKEYNEYLWNMKNKCTGGNSSLDHKKRWSSKHFLLDEIYNCARIEESKVVDLDWHYNIEAWDSYADYIASEEFRNLKHPGDKMFKYHEYSKLLFKGEESGRD